MSFPETHDLRQTLHFLFFVVISSITNSEINIKGFFLLFGQFKSEYFLIYQNLQTRFHKVYLSSLLMIFETQRYVLCVVKVSNSVMSKKSKAIRL